MIHLVSYTPSWSAGGVPRWNRDFMEGIPAHHWSWEDYCHAQPAVDNKWRPEYEKAYMLSSWLVSSGRVDLHNDIVIGDGFWAGGYYNPERTVSVCHGNWGHLLKEEVEAGKHPDFPDLHREQIRFRGCHIEDGGRLVAVSQFIQHQMKIQWGYDSDLINNAIDTKKFSPRKKEHPFNVPFLIHGVNDVQNSNKGWDHISAVIERLKGRAVVFSLDQAHQILGGDKYDVLSMADFVLIPSGHEGNSYFLLECLALGVPAVAYDVGLVWELSPYNYHRKVSSKLTDFGMILNRQKRSTEYFVDSVEWYLSHGDWDVVCPEILVERYSIENFWRDWKRFLLKNFGWLG